MIDFILQSPNKQDFVDYRIKMSFLILLMLHNPVNKLHNSYILMNPCQLVSKIPAKNYWPGYDEQAGRDLFISTCTVKYFVRLNCEL